MNYQFYDQPEQHLTKRGNTHETGAGGDASAKKSQRRVPAPAQPAWAKGLQRLYNQVVEEDLPDDLAQLLDKLDRAADGQ